MFSISSKIFPKYKLLPKKVQILYIITFLGEFYLIIPIWMFFYLQYLNYEQIALITIIQQTISIIFEVPSGAFADIFGKKLTLVIGYILYALSLILMPFGQIFWYFVGLEILKGIAKALSSGSFEALTYDSLKEDGLEDLFPSVTSNLVTISWIGYIFAGILGGFLYEIWFGLPYILLALLYFVGSVLFIIYTKEPSIDTEQADFKKYLKQNINGFKELFSNSRISSLTILLVIITLGYYTASELLGISQGKQYGLSGVQVGLIFSVGYVLSAILSSLFDKLLEKFKVASIVFSTTSVLILSFLLAKFVNPVIGAGLIMLRISSSSTFSNVKSVVLNKNITSKNRATALSSFTLLYEIGYVVVAYFAGVYIEKHSPNEFAFIVGINLLGILFVVQAIRSVYSRKQKNNF